MIFKEKHKKNLKKIHLHIGTFKTGTSSIQRFLHENKLFLAENDYFIPSSQLIGHHELPLSLIKSKTSFRAPWPEFNGGLELWDKAFNEISNTKCKNVIISSENFCDLYNENCRESSIALAGFLAEKFSGYKVSVYCYLRPIHSYCKSMYGENLKTSSLKLSFLQRMENDIFKKSIHLYPTLYLNYFSNIFGKENIYVRQYSRSLLKGNDVVLDFIDWIGLKEVPESIKKGNEENPSIPINLWPIKRAFNESSFGDFSFNIGISNSLISLHNYTEETKSSDFSMVSDEISCEHNKILNDYNLDLGSVPEDAFDFEFNSSDTHSLFMLSLLSKVLRQNNELIKRVESVESFLKGNKE